jgi:hypothetical protein
MASKTKNPLNPQVCEQVRARAREDGLLCVDAFRIAEEFGLRPRQVGGAADQAGVRLSRCQLGCFGYGEPKSIIKAAETVAPELEQAMRDGLVLGRLPCPVAWALAARFGMPKLHIANAAEKLGIRISDCQLGSF